MTTDAVLAERILAEVRAIAPGAEADVSVTTTTQALTRFANSVIHQNVSETGTELSLRVHVNGRTASASQTVSGDDAPVSALAERAVAACQVLPPDPGWPGLTSSGKLEHSGNFDEETGYAAPAVRADMVRAFIDGADGLPAAGYCQTSAVARTYLNTAGHEVSAAFSESTVDGIARAPREDGSFADGVAKLTAVRLTDIDPAALGATAAAKAHASVRPVSLPPGHYPVVIEPSAGAQLLQYIGFFGFNGRAVTDGRSFVRVGEEQFDPSLTLLDDPVSEEAVGLPFDADGTVKRRMTLVDAGVTAAAVHSRRTAAEAGTDSTGHALIGGDRFGAAPMHLRVPAGPAGTVDDLVFEVADGLLVSDFWYVRILDPRTLVCTGLTRNGVWRIQDGQVTDAVSNLRFTQSYADALAPGNLLGIGSQPVGINPSGGINRIEVPPMRLASWNFTGDSSG
ncbi:TldD/PmbA family protein [Fodinicola acaciae]|uniref:TldD/PmbA family protein n=1 Tax=Fodinicola acaciae TaxID=2681555 RepID=UPI0013D40508|nr:metallopeptidase TldD-related protein [Fodinicola acaciae]